METSINNLYEIIKCYRSHDGDFMNKDIIKNWVNQFDEEDRVFLLDELVSLLQTRYVTKQQFKEYLSTTFFRDIAGVMKKEFGQEDIKEVFKRSHFINHQPEGKSQKVILGLFEEVINEKLGLTLKDCGSGKPLCCIYLDDILCTGDTLFKGLTGTDGWFNKKTFDQNKINKDFIEENKIPIFIVFYSIHLRNMEKLINRLTYNNKLTIWRFWQDDHEIDNRFDLHNSKLQYIYPIERPEDEKINACKKQIEEKIDTYCAENGYKPPLPNFYRKEGRPQEEKFFSSTVNRNRFEKIILYKSIDIYNKAKSEKIRMRPLGRVGR